MENLIFFVEYSLFVVIELFLIWVLIFIIFAMMRASVRGLGLDGVDGFTGRQLAQELAYPKEESAMRSQATLEKKSGKKKKDLGRKATVFEAKRVYPYEDGCFSIGT